MEVNIVKLKDVVRRKPTLKQLKTDINKLIKGKKGSSKRFDIACSLFTQKKVLCLRHAILRDFLKEFLPKVYCVYKLIKEGDVVYIGSSYRVIDRILTHMNDKDFDEVLISIQETKTEMFNLEYALISHFKPKLNKNLNLKKSSDYGSNLELEKFISLGEFINTIPVIRPFNSKLKPLLPVDYTMCRFENLSVKGFSLFSFRVSEDKTLVKGCGIKGKYVSEEEDYMDVLEKLKEEGFGKYIKENAPNQNQNLLANKLVFNNSKYRYVGSDKWYHTSPTNIYNIAKEQVELSIGKDVDLVGKIFPFGKYKNTLITEVIEKDIKYIKWCIENLDINTSVSLGLVIKSEAWVYNSFIENLTGEPKGSDDYSLSPYVQAKVDSFNENLEKELKYEKH